MANEFKVKNGIKFADNTVQTTKAQDILVSGSNIKTIGGNSILGSGDLQVSGGFNYLYKTINYTAAKNDYIYANVTGGTITVTLPGTPATYDTVVIADYLGIFGTGKYVTVARNGSTIEGASNDVNLTFQAKEYTFVYIDSSWQIFTKDILQGVTSAVYLTGPTTANEGTQVSLQIVGYSASKSYTVSVSGGTAVVATSTVLWNLPSVSADTIHTLTLTEVGGGSVTHNLNVLNYNTVADTSISVTNFSVNEYNYGWVL